MSASAATSGNALRALRALFSQGLQGAREQAHRLLGFSAGARALPGLPGTEPGPALCLFAVAGASHGT
jgi:hypothetical protein